MWKLHRTDEQGHFLQETEKAFSRNKVKILRGNWRKYSIWLTKSCLCSTKIRRHSDTYMKALDWFRKGWKHTKYNQERPHTHLNDAHLVNNCDVKKEVLCAVYKWKVEIYFFPTKGGISWWILSPSY